MTLLRVQTNPSQAKGLPVFSLGFRPFFILAGIAAVSLILYWIYIFFFYGAMPYYGKINWHAHEMIYGYTVAVIAGFLLTAESNWIGRQTLSGKWLVMLALLWLLGRIVPLTAIPGKIIAVIDLAFLPVLALVLVIPLLITKQYKHLVFVGIVLVLFVGNLLFHLGHQMHGLAPGISRFGIQIGWVTVLFLIMIMGGRVIPFFVERGTGELNKTKTNHYLEFANYAGMIAWVFFYLVFPEHFITIILALFAGILQTWRLRGWYLHAIWKNPMLWVLFLGYSWIPVSFFLFAITRIIGIGHSAFLHGFTSGAIGLLTIGMMARVSLGHTGRNMTANKTTTAAFICVVVGAVLRVIGSLLQQSAFALHYSFFVQMAGIIWGLGFLLFLVVFTPILLKSRIDSFSSALGSRK